MAVQESTNRPLLSPPPDPVPRRVRIAGLVLAAYIAGVHLALAEERYSKDARWAGAVFVIGALVLVIAAAIVAKGVRFPTAFVTASWLVSAAVAAALFALFVLSRSTGLFGYHRHDAPVIQLIALVAEVGYVWLFAIALRARRSNAA